MVRLGYGVAARGRSLRSDAEWNHHLVVFMFNDMAVPDVQAFPVEGRINAGNLTRIGDDRVLPAGLLSGCGYRAKE